MKSIDYLQLLSKDYKNRTEASIEIANLKSILLLPKGSEYFFSDLHGEHESFIHLLRSASGIIRSKLNIMFKNELNLDEILDLANIIYYPEEKMQGVDFTNEATFPFQLDTIKKLLLLAISLCCKYTKSKVRKYINPKFVYIMEELLYKSDDREESVKEEYYDEMINSIIRIGLTKEFIIEICHLIQKLTVDILHIVGDIFDRGPRHDLIIDELIRFKNVDIQWGNHDISWMGAALGNEALIMNALRIAVRYNCYDMLEDGYGINLRPLYEFANKVYANDPCDRFITNIIDENNYDIVDALNSARMQKALAILQFKLEGKLIKKHKEYDMANRIMLERIDYDKGTIDIDGKIYDLADKNFPTIDKNEPLKLTKEEEKLVISLKNSFLRSRKLQEHIKFIYENGSIYKIFNGNLLYHGIVLFDEDGNFTKMKDFRNDNIYEGKGVLDYFNKIVDKAFKDRIMDKSNSENIDLMWYMWCGKYSPVFGKDVIRTFEIYFVDNKEVQKEKSNSYYKLINDEKIVYKILEEFSLSKKGHIINGHVPVKVKDGESCVKANGRLFIIDGGLSKAYQSKTGIAGYTLIYDSVHIVVAMHKPFLKGKYNTPDTIEVEKIADRLYVKDTDVGLKLEKQIEALNDLIFAYSEGLIPEKF